MSRLMQAAAFLAAFVFLSGLASAQSVAAETGSKVTRQQAQQAVDFHNKIRKDVGSPPLEWSVDLAKYAQDWANKMAADHCSLEHRPGAGPAKRVYGENIYMSEDGSATVLQAAQDWFNEKKSYKHQPLNNDNLASSGHYSQMVWRTTTKVGIGQAVCAGGGVLIVANYDPPGNVYGQKAY